ncbi:putative xaa-pro dipeptidase protein [Botrytis fragariae]|uniref:Putative xaa-pro dipeptidase protein n=1 Tax=Botrytis fragariae TaxID=1964551 RepID=A0A8H6B1J3_9HELO|nr:putative xaa-pro dipeptidase protein [Botrytis fragariae]KAF5877611.1 putative xaa-pro dipeptidase protein [Botrytis fragariae]
MEKRQSFKFPENWLQFSKRHVIAFTAFVILIFVVQLLPNFVSWPPLIIGEISLPRYEKFRRCSVNTFLETGLPWLETASPIALSEFVQRRDNLAVALESDGIDAFIVEPGYTFQYYANVSQKAWEVWEPEERPFLMIITPHFDTSLRRVVAKTSFLAPHFEEGRVRMLGMPFEEELYIVTWEEHWDPYLTLLKDWHTVVGKKDVGSTQVPKVMVDEEMRDFIQRGLGENGFEVVGLAGSVKRVKQTKTVGEVNILRAVNTGTVEALRAMRKCMVPGLTENEVMFGLDSTMRAGGMDPFFDIVLFDENAAMPHGGPNGSKVLEEETLVLIDVGSHLYGYSSDICRTFFPPFFSKPKDLSLLSPIAQHKITIWDVVFEAQTKALDALKPNSSCASVDIAARNVIADAGYEKAFTHRVGHGIGIKAHESPYLNKGNVGELLNVGMAFTLEPGIYLEEKFGVRHEDVFVVRENGEADILTGSRAKDPWDP